MLRYTLRALLRSRPFTLTAILSLALGTGATTAMFLIVNAVILRPLPYPHADRLVLLWGNYRAQGLDRVAISGADIDDFRDRTRSFEDVAATTSAVDMPYRLETGLERLNTVEVTSSLFSLLGVKPLLGRTFLPGDLEPGAGDIAMLSYRMWQQRFGGDARVIGRVLLSRNRSLAIVGVLPPDFHFYDLAFHEEPWVYRPASLDESWKDRGSRGYRTLARLRPGVRLEGAAAEIRVLGKQIAARYPESKGGWGAELVPLRTQILGKVEPALVFLFGGSFFLMLAACSNLSSLLLARAARRRKEDGIRLALGAGCSHILGQSLAETVLVCGAGSATGLILAACLVRAFVFAVGRDLSIARLQEAAIDSRAVVFTLLAAVSASAVSFVIPAWETLRFDFSKPMQHAEGRFASSLGRIGVTSWNMLVIGQVAVSLALLAVTVLMFESLRSLRNRNLGYDYRKVVSMRVVASHEKSADQRAFWGQLAEYASHLEGVQATAGIWLLPTHERGFTFPIESTEGFAPGIQAVARLHWVTPSYFSTLKVPLIEGRLFNASEDCDKSHPAVISESLARYWPEGAAIGKHVHSVLFAKDVRHTIVGVAADTYDSVFRTRAQPTLYVCEAHFAYHLLVRTTANPNTLAGSLAHWVRAVDKSFEVDEITTLEDIIHPSFTQPRLQVFVAQVFAGIAVLLTVTGLYGLIAYRTAARTQEFGIRMALGARPRDLRRLIFQGAMALSLTGTALGLALVAAFRSVLSALLYGVSPTNPVVYAGVAALLGAVALLAAHLPARRATRIDPMEALRHE